VVRRGGYKPLVSARINKIRRDIRIYFELRAVARRFLFCIQPQVLPDEKPAAVSFVYGAAHDKAKEAFPSHLPNILNLDMTVKRSVYTC